MIILGYKPIGWTMLDLTQEFQKEYINQKVSFAGRLDPMASGVVKMLIGKSAIQKNISESIGDKIYTFDLIHGITTDSYDILGIPQISSSKAEIITNGEYVQEYPPFSSVYIKEHKMPYWQATLRGLNITNKPTKKINISSFTKLSEKIINKDDFIHTISKQFNLLTKDTFRQKEILKKWQELDFENVKITTFTVTISSGGYVRWIANKMGGCAMNIQRIKYI